MRGRLEKIKKNKETLGGADFMASDSNWQKIGKSVNFKLDLENLLKLRLALEAVSLELNGYHKGQLRKENIGVNICLFSQEKQGEKMGRMTVTIE